MTSPLRTWTQIGGPAATLITGGNDLYATNPDTGDIWQWNDQQVVYHYDGTPYNWTQIGGPADAIAAAGDYLYALSPGTHNVWAWKIR